MITLVRSKTFDRWLHRLRDKIALVRILARLKNAGEGNFGDVKAVGAGVLEMRVHVGPGYRLYYTVRAGTIVFYSWAATSPHSKSTSGARRRWRTVSATRSRHAKRRCSKQTEIC